MFFPTDDMRSEIWTKAYLPNDTSVYSETDILGTYTEPQGKLAANLDNRVLHGHLKWRPELIKDIAVRFALFKLDFRISTKCLCNLQLVI